VPERPSHEIRKYALEHYIKPARRRGHTEVKIVAKEVLAGLGYASTRAPAVCSALKAKKFLSENHLVLQNAEGPPKMQSPTVTYTFHLLGGEAPDEWSEIEAAFQKVRGVAKEAFRRLGGGEAFIRRQRERFYDREPES